MKENKVVNWVKKNKLYIGAAGLTAVSVGVGIVAGRAIEHERLNDIMARISKDMWADYDSRYTIANKLGKTALTAEVCDILDDLGTTITTLRESGEKPATLQRAESLIDDVQIFYDVYKIKQ